MVGANGAGKSVVVRGRGAGSGAERVASLLLLPPLCCCKGLRANSWSAVACKPLHELRCTAACMLRPPLPLITGHFSAARRARPLPLRWGEARA